MKPLMIDLFCGLGGWAEGGLAEGYDVVGFDIEQHVYGDHRYPAQLVVQDVLTLHGSQFKGATLIVASPPCQEFSYMAMPWTKAKAKAADYRSGRRDVRQLTALFDACFRIQREACETAGRHIPLVVENVRGAIPWVGRSRWNFGSFHLWGDVPALMPMTGIRRMKSRVSCSPRRFSDRMANTPEEAYALHYRLPDGRKVPQRIVHVRDGAPHTKHLTNPDEHVKLGGSWFHGYRQGQGPRNHGSKSKGRKMASAMIAKIPLPLSRHIAATYLSTEARAA